MFLSSAGDVATPLLLSLAAGSSAHIGKNGISDVNQGSPSGKPIKSQEVGTCYGPLLLIPGITV
ncbi:hypothetical protein RRG08_003159 [Elysia crispata]|uniref:Uncharacterized protein n=1 Tax=Elysia crispata TaxID=231223 RepID=A0AAE1B7Q4_9GAST|nr:hypothetical protein RRG08_003159 [Elysia crispata]